MEIEEVQKDLGAMTTEEQRAAVMRDVPELAALLADLQSSLAEVRSRVGPLLKEVRRAHSVCPTSQSMWAIARDPPRKELMCSADCVSAASECRKHLPT